MRKLALDGLFWLSCAEQASIDGDYRINPNRRQHSIQGSVDRRLGSRLAEGLMRDLLHLQVSASDAWCHGPLYLVWDESKDSIKGILLSQ
jgi:hypothetical protein